MHFYLNRPAVIQVLAAAWPLTLCNVVFVVVNQSCLFLFVDLCRSLVEDLEYSQEQIWRGWKALEEKRKLTQLKEVCECMCV